MDFKASKPIYMQIVEFCFQKILTSEWIEDERIPSVRELGGMLQVNPNTAMRAFEFMQSEEVIYPKRGMGYFVAKDAQKQISKIQKKEFFDETLPETFRVMDLLDITIEEVVECYKESKK